MTWSDYIVFVDESGDHGLSKINSDYPMFVLAFCMFSKEDYISRATPVLQRFKFKHFGHDQVVLHEHDIRKSKGPFARFRDRTLRGPFLQDVTALVQEVPMTVVACCIRKNAFLERRGVRANPYHVAMEFGLERIFFDLQGRGQRGRKTHVVFETRGKREDAELELEFRRVLDQSTCDGLADSLEIVFSDKKDNAPGLQLADLIARPIGRHVLDPQASNPPYDTIEPKLRRGRNGRVEGFGLKCYP